jgi:hypothetical protein
MYRKVAFFKHVMGTCKAIQLRLCAWPAPPKPYLHAIPSTGGVANCKESQQVVLILIHLQHRKIRKPRALPVAIILAYAFRAVS